MNKELTFWSASPIVFILSIVFAIPCFVYVMFKLLIHREESLMEKTYGQAYIDYRNRTPAIFPKIRKFKK